MNLLSQSQSPFWELEDVGDSGMYKLRCLQGKSDTNYLSHVTLINCCHYSVFWVLWLPVECY